MGALVVLYARYYMSSADPVPRFFSFLLGFMGAMLGIVLSGNLIQLVVFWELTSLTSFMLIAYWYHREDARRGARMALVVTMTGGFSLLLGVLVLGAIVGSYDLDAVLASADAIRAHDWYPVALLLILGGVLTKSAQFPFHFWLPHAMAAPTPVSAYLHSAAMVKAGVFLLARLWPALAGTELWFWTVSSAGAASLLLGAISATFQKDMKGVLAYSTISHLGLITLLLGMNTRLALVAAVFHMMNHATFKASLFMAAGIVDHETGTRDLSRLSGLRHLMPITAVVATVAAAAMAGVPLLNGFLSKEMFFAESIAAGDASGLRFTLPIMATLAGVFSVAYSMRLIHQVFFGPVSQDLPRMPARADARHAVAERVARDGLPARRHVAGADGRPAARLGRVRDPGRRHADLPARRLAWPDAATRDEPRCARRRRRLLPDPVFPWPRDGAHARAVPPERGPRPTPSSTSRSSAAPVG